MGPQHQVASSSSNPIARPVARCARRSKLPSRLRLFVWPALQLPEQQQHGGEATAQPQIQQTEARPPALWCPFVCWCEILRPSANTTAALTTTALTTAALTTAFAFSCHAARDLGRKQLLLESAEFTSRWRPNGGLAELRCDHWAAFERYHPHHSQRTVGDHDGLVAHARVCPWLPVQRPVLPVLRRSGAHSDRHRFGGRCMLQICTLSVPHGNNSQVHDAHSFGQRRLALCCDRG